ncbi:hypothetical protein C8R42DRAFT_781305 [Lentinula raphanica]|nr:hypothetical protein C8R42DRAFT_781305 [Lentinula raphanica]
MSSQNSDCTWTSNIYRLINPNSSSSSSNAKQRSNSSSAISLPSNTDSSRRYIRPPGVLWRSFVAQCVFNDLLALELRPHHEHAISSTSRKLAQEPQRQRRFARMAEYGLGAVIFYEIPIESPSEFKLENIDHEDPSASQYSDEQWTLTGVFGSSDTASESGMSVEELLEGIDVRIVYVPLYACTSFVTGQVMNNFLRKLNTAGERSMAPICVPGGFGFAVDSKGFDLFDNGLGSTTPLDLSVSLSLDTNVLDDSTPQLQETHTTQPIPGAFLGHSDMNAEEEQWEFDWVDAHLRHDSLPEIRSAEISYPRVPIVDNSIFKPESYEEVDEEDSFVTALESFVSDDLQSVSILQEENSVSDTVADTPESLFTPKLSAVPNAGDSKSPLNSITNSVSTNSSSKLLNKSEDQARGLKRSSSVASLTKIVRKIGRTMRMSEGGF